MSQFPSSRVTMKHTLVLQSQFYGYTQIHSYQKKTLLSLHNKLLTELDINFNSSSYLKSRKTDCKLWWTTPMTSHSRVLTCLTFSGEEHFVNSGSHKIHFYLFTTSHILL